MNKFVVYTAIVGNYDTVNQPQALDERFDYVLFSNDIVEKQVGVWQVRNIPYENEDKTRIARWVKTHPEELLPEYEVSLWMDGNLVIKTDFVYRHVLELFESGTLVSSLWHDQRDCAYDEAVEVVVSGLEHENVVVDWLHFLVKEKYPKQNGLFETCVMFRNHKSLDVQELDNLWWNCIDHYSRRDQLSFNYSVWKKGLDCPFFFGPKENVINSAHILYVANHIGTDKKWREVITNKKDDALFFYYSQFKKRSVDRSWLKRIYFFAARSLFPKTIIRLLGLFYGALNLMKPLKKKILDSNVKQ